MASSKSTLLTSITRMTTQLKATEYFFQRVQILIYLKGLFNQLKNVPTRRIKTCRQIIIRNDHILFI
jgi:hypothetical protein